MALPEALRGMVVDVVVSLLGLEGEAVEVSPAGIQYYSYLKYKLSPSHSVGKYISLFVYIWLGSLK